MGVLFSATDESLDDLVIAAQTAATNDTAAMAALLKRFEGLTLSIARSLTNNRSLQDDAAQGARLGLVSAVRAHKPGTPGFPAYAKRYMRGAALRVLMAMQATETMIDPADYEWLEKPPRDAALDSTLEVTDLFTVLTAEQRVIATAHYLEDVSVSDLARTLGVSKPAISQRFATIHRALRPVAEGALAA